MEGGYARKDEDVHPQLLDLIPTERSWLVNKDNNVFEGSKDSHENGDEKKLELRLGPPCVEDWSLSYAPQKAPQKRSAPAPVVGWPPVKSSRKNIASSSSKPAPVNVKKEKMVESCQKGFFVKINMNGVPIGRKVDLNAYGSYEKLSVAVDELFRGLLAVQNQSSGGGINAHFYLTTLPQHSTSPFFFLLPSHHIYFTVYKMIGSFLTRGLVMVFGYAYPAYECFKSVEKNKPDIEQLRFWCQYWILVAVLTVCERIGDTFISWVPMYSEAKLAFYIYLWYPKTKGTSYVYDSFFQPYISKHETEIDRNLSELRTMAGDMTVLYWQRAASYVQTRTFDIIQYVASQSTPKPRPSKPPQPVEARQPAPNQKGQPAAQQQETREPPSPAANSSSSSSSSNSGSDEIEIQSGAGKPQVPPVPAVTKAPKATPTKNPDVTTELQTTTEPERKQIEPAGSYSSKASPSTLKEIMMDEPGRITRARLRKAISLQ